MTGQDIQARLDAIVEDLQTFGKGQTTNIVLRGANNATTIYPLSSDAGVVNAAQLAAIQAVVDTMKPIADSYEAGFAPVSVASTALSQAKVPHQNLFQAYGAARTALNTALEADNAYQAAKDSLESAQQNAAYIAARTAYKANNVSENFGNLQDAKGKYVV
jgi:hypothetical protein